VRKEFLGRGWRFPFGFDSASGGTAMSEYEENIRQCVTVILSTKPGERQMLPDFGCRIHELMFAPNTPAISTMIALHVESALTLWEPRVTLTNVDAWPEPGGTIRVAVSYTIKSTMTEQELSLLLTSGG
jgi:phage baseplate assembly protein W